MQLTLRFTAALAALALAACSESPLAPDATAPPSSQSTTALTPSSAPAPAAPTFSLGTVTRTVAVVACTGTTVYLSADEKRTLDLHNQQRAASGLPTFCLDPKLTTAARSHSDEMLTKNYFSHNSYDGSPFYTRLIGFGYTPYTALAENIAWGNGTYGAPDAIFTNWMSSAGHRANILNGSLRQIGIAVSNGTFQTYAGAKMYTVDFGTH